MNHCTYIRIPVVLPSLRLVAENLLNLTRTGLQVEGVLKSRLHVKADLQAVQKQEKHNQCARVVHYT